MAFLWFSMVSICFWWFPLVFDGFLGLLRTLRLLRVCHPLLGIPSEVGLVSP